MSTSTVDELSMAAMALGKSMKGGPWFDRVGVGVREDGKPAIFVYVRYLESHVARKYVRGWCGYPVEVRRAVQEPSTSKGSLLS